MRTTRLVALAPLLLVGGGVALADGDAKKPKTPAVQARVQALRPFLRQGELVLVQSKPNGQPRAATTFARVAAPAETVWETLRDYPAFRRFVPRCVSARVVRFEGDTYDVAYEIDVPMGRNYRYVVRFKQDLKQRTLDGRWLSGDMKGGHWTWRVYADGKQTVLSYRAHNEGANANRILRALDDKHHTMAYALEVSSSYVVVKAMKKEAERRAKAMKKEAKPKRRAF